MSPEQLRQMLDEVQAGTRPAAEAHQTLLGALRAEPLANLGFARVDHHRSTRQGFPEVILGLGKTPRQIAAIAATIAERDHPLLVTRATPEAFEAVQAVVSAGTSDLPVAEEAGVTAELMGNTVERIYDVGVAGIHRVLRERHRLEAARVLIVVAGMEGALPSVAAGLVSVPVIAVPTSIGYGTSFGGLAALLGMLNSCANGVTVVNIDNGFGAGCVASMINHL